MLLTPTPATTTNSSSDTIAAIDSRRVRVGRRMKGDIGPLKMDYVVIIVAQDLSLRTDPERYQPYGSYGSNQRQT